MSCYHPLRAFWTGDYTANGKKEYIVGKDIDHIEFYNGSWHKVYSDKIYKSKPIREFIEIPCGHCIGCRLDYAKSWADRCVMELDYHENNYFLTLTYDNNNLPLSGYHDQDTGMVLPTLYYRDVTLFIKSLRKFLKSQYMHKLIPYLPDFKYFYCGEYGEGDTMRPHYHMIAYDLPLLDLKPYKRTPNGDLLFTSDVLNKIWSHGYVVVGEVTWSSCRYVAGYVQKKAYSADAFYEYDSTGRVRPRTFMSLKPAIGKRFYLDHKDELYKYDHITIKGIEIRPGRYFDKLLDLDDPDLLAAIKERKVKTAQDMQQIILSNTSLDIDDQRKVEERKKQRQIKTLQRNL